MFLKKTRWKGGKTAYEYYLSVLTVDINYRIKILKTSTFPYKSILGHKIKVYKTPNIKKVKCKKNFFIKM